jgi:hypothetical protein
MQDPINEFTDYLRDEFQRYQQWSLHAVANGEYDKRFRYECLRDQAWETLYRYRDTVLKLRRYTYQRRYADKILRELNEPYFEAIEAAIRKGRRRGRKPPPNDPGALTLFT